MIKIRQVHQAHAGHRERREMVSAAEVSAHCDAFFRKRGMSVSRTPLGHTKTTGHYEGERSRREMSGFLPGFTGVRGVALDERLIEEQCCAVYSAYPRKVGKPCALAKIRKAIRVHGYDFILERTQAFAKAREGAEMQYTPHPATWFHQERFNDDPATWNPASASKRNVLKEKIDVPITRA